MGQRELGIGCFHADGPWKQDVVLKVNMLVKILLEVSQSVVERVICWAGFRWGGEAMAERMNLSEQHTSFVVLLGEHFDWADHCSEAGLRLRAVVRPGSLKQRYIWEEDRFFFGQMLG